MSDEHFRHLIQQSDDGNSRSTLEIIEDDLIHRHVVPARNEEAVANELNVSACGGIQKHLPTEAGVTASPSVPLHVVSARVSRQ